MFTPDQLKSAAAAQNAQIRSRVRDVQGGVPTYFDALVLDILRRLELSESSHGWNTDPPESPDRDSTGTASLLQWLAAYLADRTQGRFVSYEDRVRRR